MVRRRVTHTLHSYGVLISLSWCVWCTVNSSNGPLGRVSYPQYGVQTAQCPFVCLNPSLYANEAYNACIPTPIGFYSPNGGQTLLPCRRTGIS